MADNGLRGNLSTRDRVLSGAVKSGANGFSANVPGSLELHYARNGATFTPAVSDDGILSWTNDQNLANPAPVDIRGKDGISPTVSVEGIDGGHRVSITDKDGAKTFDVMDGKDGYTPVKGKDYYTEADKTEMVNAVVAVLPVYDGEVIEL